jgi:hypothetical protein
MTGLGVAHVEREQGQGEHGDGSTRGSLTAVSVCEARPPLRRRALHLGLKPIQALFLLHLWVLMCFSNVFFKWPVSGGT